MLEHEGVFKKPLLTKGISTEPEISPFLTIPNYPTRFCCPRALKISYRCAVDYEIKLVKQLIRVVYLIPCIEYIMVSHRMLLNYIRLS